MPVYKDEDGKRWRAVYRVRLRDGSSKQKSKRGFRTKKEAEEFIIQQQKAMKTDLGMTVETFINEKYMPDIKAKVRLLRFNMKRHLGKRNARQSRRNVFVNGVMKK